MKKVFFTILAVLTALAVFSCNGTSLANEPNEPVEYTADGRPLVDLTIGTGNAGRALTQPLAKAGADFYEVTFYDTVGAKYYRASWDFTRNGRIRIPAGDYSDADKAILFAGNYADKTLLAVGIISANDGSLTIGEITPTTRSVTFTLEALLTDVLPSPLSSFKITAPAGPPSYLTSSYTTLNFPKVLFDSKILPMFLVPKDDTTIEATFSIKTTLNDFEADYCPGIYVVDDGVVYSRGVSSLNGDAPVLVDATISAPEADDTMIADIAITIKTPDEDGLSRIAVSVPVCAIDPGDVPTNAYAEPVIWYIRGGLQNGLFDEGAITNSIGGAILLGVGGVSIIDIIIAGP